MDNKKELAAHFERNEKMWHVWEERGIKTNEEFIVNFHFYSARKQNTELLCKELTDENLEYRVKTTRTLWIFRGWMIEVDIKKQWSLEALQGKTANMFMLSLQTGVSLEGCGAFMPN